MKYFIFLTCLVAFTAARVIEDVPEQGLQGYFDTLKEIYYKLKELGHDTVCGQTVSELIDLLGLPDFLDGIVATARGWICNSVLSARLQIRDASRPEALQGYFDTLREIIAKLKELGHETVCGQTVSELIDLLGLPDFLDGIVATARGFICSALSARLEVRDAAQPQALQGYFDTLREIIAKLRELGHETVCGQTVTELIDLLGLPDFLDGIVATARGFICNALSVQLKVRDASQPQALQGYFDTLREIIAKLRELGHETVCGQTVSELIDLLGLPDFLDGIVATARGFICSALSARLEVRDAAQPQALQGYFDTLREIIAKLRELGHDTVCGQTVSELIDLLGLPDFLDGIVATARGFICSALSLQERSDVLQGEGYFDTLMEIFQKLLQLGQETVCSETVSELIDLLGLPDSVEGLVATARGWICSV